MTRRDQARRIRDQQDLAPRNAAHVPRYWMLLTPAEAHDLAEGRIPDQVQQMAKWLDEDRVMLCP